MSGCPTGQFESFPVELSRRCVPIGRISDPETYLFYLQNVHAYHLAALGMNELREGLHTSEYVLKISLHNEIISPACVPFVMYFFQYPLGLT